MKTSIKRVRIRRKRGYSLLEALIYFAIVTLIIGVVGPQLVSYMGRAKGTTALLQIAEIQKALTLYYYDTGRYPAENPGLSSLLLDPLSEDGWAGPYLSKESAIRDPWNRTYRYRFPGQNGEFDVYSLGRDGLEGGTGEDSDISN